MVHVESHFIFGVHVGELITAFAIACHSTNFFRTRFLLGRLSRGNRTRTTIQVREPRVCKREHFDMQ